MEIDDLYIPTFEHINEYRKRLRLPPYPTKPIDAPTRIKKAFELIAAGDTVVLLTCEEVIDIITRAVNGEFDDKAPQLCGDIVNVK